MRKGKRSQYAKNALTVDQSQSHQSPLKTPSRPRTRAWVKQEQQEQEQEKQQQQQKKRIPATKANVSKPVRFSRRLALQRGESLEDSLPSANHSIVPDPGGIVSRPRGQRSTLAKTAAPAKSTRKGGTSVTKGPLENTKSVEVSSWLREVQVISPAPIPEVRTPDAPDTEDEMDSTSKSKTTNEFDSTLKVARAKATKISEKKLRYRHIWLNASPDEKLAHFQTILITELPARSLKDTEDLQHLMRDFLQQATEHSADICYPSIDEFSFNFDRAKSKLSYPIVNEEYFQADLKRCLARNEAILQRTIMIHIIDHYWLGEKFDWNCEGQWSLSKDSCLPSTNDDLISLPKPDMAISFTLESFTQADADSEPIPEHLEKTMSPDGDPRCFPFLFMEVKKAGADLQEAYMTNLHNASQALFNMYTWVVGTEETMKDFFRDARVFSLVFNAQDLSVRIHRPFRLENGDLSFRFDEFWPLARYSRNKACQLIKTILNDYAAKELHKILKNAFAEVTKQQYEIVRSKRKAELARRGSSKRVRRSRDLV